ncbi:hypothetical protein LCGC14_1038730 [marine sediment metagenome]|uniref:Uncharacterized protein n=1 Tax=marine sediment metagenome TaxID=412755 RepID=A0A0F9NE18_9ZZZZ
MKTQTGYIYHEGISAERKPERLDFKQPGNFYYQTALKEFEDNLIPAVNAHVSQHPIEGHDEITILKPVFKIHPRH